MIQEDFRTNKGWIIYVHQSPSGLRWIIINQKFSNPKVRGLKISFKK